jgi:hypothetical protein
MRGLALAICLLCLAAPQISAKSTKLLCSDYLGPSFDTSGRYVTLHDELKIEETMNSIIYVQPLCSGEAEAACWVYSVPTFGSPEIRVLKILNNEVVDSYYYDGWYRADEYYEIDKVDLSGPIYNVTLDGQQVTVGTKNDALLFCTRTNKYLAPVPEFDWLTGTLAVLGGLLIMLFIRRRK